MARKPEGELRRGWTTGACATAAARAAYTAYLTGVFPDPVQIVLPKGETQGLLKLSAWDWDRADADDCIGVVLVPLAEVAARPRRPARLCMSWNRLCRHAVRNVCVKLSDARCDSTDTLQTLIRKSKSGMRVCWH